jgi:hypothetical protein
LSPR